MLTIEGLKAGYGGKAVVSIPSFSLAAGEHCLILGASGSGKTTLLYALAGLLKPMEGRVMLGDVEMTGLSGRKADAFRGQHIGIIYQTLHMVEALSVLDNLLLARYAAGLPQNETEATALLSALGLADLQGRLPRQLSQGQRQRVAIARAAINAPRLILGDEPTSALDDAACEAVVRLLLETARAKGASLIVATHDKRIVPYFERSIRLEDSPSVIPAQAGIHAAPLAQVVGRGFGFAALPGPPARE